MSYDFTLRIPKAQRKAKLKSGPHPEQLQRLQRAREILTAFEPDITFHDDTGMFTAYSAELGDVYVEYDKISLGMSMGTEPRVLYNAIHGLLKRFHTEGYEASDPQVRSDIVYVESFVEFMRQYRSHFSCNTEEFEQWCRGETPPAWADRAAERERGNAIAASVMPRDRELEWQEFKETSDDALWEYLQKAIRDNDAAIAEHGLAGYMKTLSDEAQRSFPLSERRLDGSCYPDSDTPWFNGSRLHYECCLLLELMNRGYPAAVRDQPQRVTVCFDLPADPAIHQTHYFAMRASIHPIYPILKKSGLIHYDMILSINENTHEYRMYGKDADAIHTALMAQFDLHGGYRPTRIKNRYGDVGAREVEVSCAVEP